MVKVNRAVFTIGPPNGYGKQKNKFLKFMISLAFAYRIAIPLLTQFSRAKHVARPNAPAPPKFAQRRLRYQFGGKIMIRKRQK